MGPRLDEADDQRDVAKLALERVEDMQLRGDKARLENQVARRVAGDGEFRREHDLGAVVRGVLVGGEDLAGVRGQIAHGPD